MGLAYCGITTANVVVGYGRHAVFLTESALEMAILLNTISFLFGILSFALPKLAVSAMLCRILNPNTANRIMLWGLTVFAAIVSILCIIILFTMCDPPKALWLVQLQQQGAKCRDSWILVDYAMFTGGMFNVSCLAISMKLIWQLSLLSSIYILPSTLRPSSCIYICPCVSVWLCVLRWDSGQCECT